MSSDAFICKVLRLKAKRGLSIDDFCIWVGDWNKPSDELHIAAQCSDIFWWGTADNEEITADNLRTFEQAYEDLVAVDEEYLTPELFCARVRGMRPQGAWYQQMKLSDEAKALFDACGPRRESGFGNPQEQD